MTQPVFFNIIKTLSIEGLLLTEIECCHNENKFKLILFVANNNYNKDKNKSLEVDKEGGSIVEYFKCQEKYFCPAK